MQIPGPLVQVQGEASIFLIACEAGKGIFFIANQKWDSRVRGNDAVDELAMQEESEVNTAGLADRLRERLVFRPAQCH